MLQMRSVLSGVLDSLLMEDYRDEMVKCVWQLQNKLVTNLLNAFSTDLWNKVSKHKITAKF